MDKPISVNEKKEANIDGTAGVYAAGDHATMTGSDTERNYGAKEEFYDPALESRATRLGINLESFKRAPGITR
jgi:amino acid transporter